MRLFAWEKDQVGELSLLVTYIVLHEVKQDIQDWLLHSSKCYYVSSVYDYLISTDNTNTLDNNNNVQVKEVLLKVSCLFNGCFKIAFRQKITCLGEEMLLTMMVFAQVVVWLKIEITCLSDATSLASYGLWWHIGYALILWDTTFLMTISCNLVLWEVILKRNCTLLNIVWTSTVWII